MNYKVINSYFSVIFQGLIHATAVARDILLGTGGSDAARLFFVLG